MKLLERFNPPRMVGALLAEDARDVTPAAPPEPAKPATEILQGHLERAALNLHAREKRLVLEIADREAELADVRRAASAAQTALIELDIANVAEA